tara:strand:- start:263 stop:604 length:342 start_codon:yes stop_codon:yes gene_type:complete
VKVAKGDLVLVSDGVITNTCIILTPPYRISPEGGGDFYYSYCIEDGLYGLVYNREIISIVSTQFAPDFEFESELFNSDYSYYADLYDRFSYFPQVFPYLPDETDDDDSDDDVK